MSASLVMTVIGPDRPGLVESLSSVISRHGGNWVESHMARLCGEFAGILRVTVPGENLEGLTQALKDLEKKTDLTIIIKTGVDEGAPDTGVTLGLEIVGHDRPGIVQRISEVISARNGNVLEITSECLSAPMTAETLFQASVTLQLPTREVMEALKQDLENLADNLMVDLNWEPNS